MGLLYIAAAIGAMFLIALIAASVMEAWEKVRNAPLVKAAEKERKQSQDMEEQLFDAVKKSSPNARRLYEQWRESNTHTPTPSLVSKQYLPESVPGSGALGWHMHNPNLKNAPPLHLAAARETDMQVLRSWMNVGLDINEYFLNVKERGSRRKLRMGIYQSGDESELGFTHTRWGQSIWGGSDSRHDPFLLEGTPLWFALKGQSDSAVMELLDRGADPNTNCVTYWDWRERVPHEIQAIFTDDRYTQHITAGKDLMSPLQWACIHNPHPSLLKALVDDGAEWNAAPGCWAYKAGALSPLLLALDVGDFDLAKTLLSLGASLDDCRCTYSGADITSALIFSIWDEWPTSVIQWIIENGAEINSDGSHRTPKLRRESISSQQHPHSPHNKAGCELSHLMRQRQWTITKGDSPISVAAKLGRADIALKLLDLGADPNRQTPCGLNAVDWALRFEQFGTAQLLIDRGHIPAACNKALRNIPDSHTKQSHLYRASRKAWPSLVLPLIKIGSDVNSRLLPTEGAPSYVKSLKGRTALMAAAHDNPEPDMVETLVNAGADLDAQDGSGQTALMHAYMHNDVRLVYERLLELGADKSVKDFDGKTVIDLTPNSNWDRPPPF